jgi:RimJ/RimL family protein N-acetyltransferase
VRIDFPDSFSTARLRAERLRADHYDAIRAMDSDAEYMALLGGTRTAAETKAYLDFNLQHWDDYGFGLWMLRDQAGAMAGRCAIRHLDVEGTDEVELGYGFHTRYWRQGLATEIAKELLRLGLEELHLPTMVAITRHSNIGSQRVLIKTGLVYQRDVDHEGVPHLLYRSVK